MDDQDFSLDSAKRAADEERLEGWVVAFLASPGSDNAELGEELRGRIRHWLGPIEVEFDRLHRLAGPPGAPVIEEVDDDYWDERVDDLAEKVDGDTVPPPVIAVFDDGQLVLEDGNHRVEALRRTGATEGWAVVGFEDAEQLRAFRTEG